jgi:hypothetical protein
MVEFRRALFCCARERDLEEVDDAREEFAGEKIGAFSGPTDLEAARRTVS